MKAKLDALPPAGKKEGTPEFQSISKQKQFNEKELVGLTNAVQKLKSLGEELPRLVSRSKSEIPLTLANPDSANVAILKPADEALASLWRSLEQIIVSASKTITATEAELSQVSNQLREAHAGQEAKYLSLQHLNQEAVKAFEARATAEKESATVVTLQQQKAAASAELQKLQVDRKALKAAYLLTRDKVSELREGVANRLQSEAGAKVRIRVQRNADILEYQQQLLNSLWLMTDSGVVRAKG